MEDICLEERNEIISILEACQWNRVEAAKKIGMRYSSFWLKIDRLKILPPEGKWPSLQRGMNRIEQSPRIATQIIKALEGHDGPITLNINMPMNATQIACGKNEDFEIPDVSPPNDLQLISLIDSFPQPRLKNLIEHIYYIIGHKMGQAQGSEWLGISRRTLDYRRRNRIISDKANVLKFVRKEIQG